MPLLRRPRSVSAVVFDVGETLVDETRAWQWEASRAGIPAFTLFGALGALIAERRHHAEVWDLLGVDPPTGEPFPFTADDLYADVPACLRDLRERGIRIAIAGNQPRRAAAAIDALGLPVDVVATSAGLGVAKPDPAFFRRLSELLGQPPGSIASVGDRVDNDVLPAQAAGLVGIHLRRGPWGAIHSGWPEAARADGHLVSLEGLGERLLG